MVTRVKFVLVALGLLACQPEAEGRPSWVKSPRVLAVRSSPAEAKPDTSVTLDALYVAPENDPDPSTLDWALCNAPKPLAAPGPVARECLEPAGSALTALGDGGSVPATIPKNVCRVFGPTPPDPKPGEPAIRPADPDTTGGYYQPIRLLFGDDYAIGVTRIACGLGGATQDQAIDFAERYRPNENPVLDRVVVHHADGSEEDLVPDGSGAPLGLRVGESVTLRAEWADCPLTPSCGDGICGAREDATNCAGDCTQPKGCTGSEPYVVLDPIERRLVDRRESMRVSWFSSAGSFEHDRTGRAADAAGTPSSENRFRLPSEPGEVRLWVVLRDDRGGVGFAGYRLAIAP